MKHFLKKWRFYILYAWFFSLFINVLQLTFSVYMLLVYDRVLASYSLPTLTLITLAAFLAVSVSGVLENIRSKLLVRCGVDIDHTLSDHVLAAVVKQHSLPGQQPDATLRDVNVLRNFFAGASIFFLFDLPWAPIFLAVIFVLHPILGAFATSGSIILLILALLNEWLGRKLQEKADHSHMQASRFVSQSLDNAEIIRAMGMIQGVAHRRDEINNCVIHAQTIASRRASSLQSITEGFRQVMQVGIYGVGAYLAVLHQASPGCMIAASIIMGRALAPIQNGIVTWKGLVEARQAYKRLDKLVSENDKDLLPCEEQPCGPLSVDHLGWAVDTKTILEDLHFSLKTGESLAVIGPSGAGKSTLCRLLLGLWSPTNGAVTLNSMNVAEMNQEELGQYVGYVPQDVELFAGPISTNIARFQEVDSEKVIEAATMAGVHDLILTMPNGYDTFIGPGGHNLSGGQRQRIALARALYNKPSILIMDEPDSNLDDAGIASLVHSWRFLKKMGCMSVVVTHNPVLLQHVDTVLVLHNGRQVKFGSAAECTTPKTDTPQNAAPSSPPSSNAVIA